MIASKILATATAVPKNRFSQSELLGLLGRADTLRKSFFAASGITGRNLYISKNFSFGETSGQAAARARQGVKELALDAARRCFKKASVAAKKIDFLAATTCTMSACPNLDVELIGALKLRSNIERLAIADVGSASGVLAFKRASDYLAANPGKLALVVASEVCSAWYQKNGPLDSTVGEAIFADGAAAILLGANAAKIRPGFSVIGQGAAIAPKYAHAMRFEFENGRRRFVLDKEIRDLVPQLLFNFIGSFLKNFGISKGAIRYWILHPAGPKILDSAQTLLGLAEKDLQFSRAIFQRYGNMASATSFFVLDRVLAQAQPRVGELALFAAMGPGLGIEGTLLRWQK